ncbi:putative uncharacterized protein [Mycolicibacterium canariasense]|uniref:ATP-binding protein n=1 Tax=Mycolicibacterium canariasense TaxID=228230 RepID=A0A100WEU6_MYCCR|nr:AAA family ATPase [Mycolicibacterium canariasense]MCV7211350.1 ATP-binding protein [Mycolicibacterium canariasense]ORV03800.1 hypothetical protein AWB94_23870 [Mycolicibacterium canariasense]GAS97297.1 putative uncharacterized protein [Mycolicibacterium canariasense]
MTAATPVVAVVLGPAGSGKSSVSRRLACRLGAAHLDKDTIVGGLTEEILRLAGHDPHDRDNNPYYVDNVMPLEYAALLRVAGDCLRAGTSVVLDAPFGAFLDDTEFLTRASLEYEWPPAQRLVIRVVTDADTIRRRIVRRGLSRDTWKLEHWDEFWARASARDVRWSDVTCVDVDSSGDSVDLTFLDGMR